MTTAESVAGGAHRRGVTKTRVERLGVTRQPLRDPAKRGMTGMSDWDTFRDKAVAGLTSVAHEGTRQARMAKSKLQLSDLKAQRQEALRDLGQAVLIAKNGNTSLDKAQAGWDSLWARLSSLDEKERNVRGAIGHEEAGETGGRLAQVPEQDAAPTPVTPGRGGKTHTPSTKASKRLCTRCGDAVAKSAKFCSACGTVAPN